MPTLTRWNPVREIDQLHSEMDRLFAAFTGGNRAADQPQRSKDETVTRAWSIALDVAEDREALTLKAALPGVDPADINIEVQDQTLTLSAMRHLDQSGQEGGYRWVEQQYGSFSRRITLPTYVNTDGIEADYKNGVLELRIPKREDNKPRKIPLGTEKRTFQSENAALDSGADTTGGSASPSNN